MIEKMFFKVEPLVNFIKTHFAALFNVSVVVILLIFIPQLRCNKYTAIATIVCLGGIAILSPRIVFPPFFLLLAYLLCVDCHIIRIYGTSFTVIGKELLVVTGNTNLDEIRAYLKVLSIWDYIRFFVIVPLLVCFNWYPIPYCCIKRNKRHNCFIHVILLSVFLVTIFSMGIPGKWIIQTKRYLIDMGGVREYCAQKNKFIWGAEASEGSIDNIVVLIGEAHRYDFFQKYKHLLTQNKYYPLFFENMISQGTHTCLCVPQIMSRKPIEETSLYFYEPSLFKLFEEAGYETHAVTYLPLLRSKDTPLDFIWMEAQNFHYYFDSKEIVTKLNFYGGDEQAVDILQRLLKNNGKKKFIVIKMIGCHYDFETRYPDDYDVIKPSLKGFSYPYEAKFKDLFVNTYENNFRYSMELIAKMCNIVEKSQRKTLLVFSSDHGFNIFDNGHWFYPVTKETYHIPCFWFANSKCFDSEMDHNKIVFYNNQIRKLSDKPLVQSVLFESIATFSGIRRQQYNPQKDIFSQKYKEDVRKRKVKTLEGSWYFYEDLN